MSFKLETKIHFGMSLQSSEPKNHQGEIREAVIEIARDTLPFKFYDEPSSVVINECVLESSIADDDFGFHVEATVTWEQE